MPTAVLIDGAFFITRFRKVEPHNRFDHERAAEQAFRWAVTHLRPKAEKNTRRELHRIFFYDCPPLEKKAHNPISGKHIDFSKSEEARFRRELHGCLLKKRKVALRLGHLSPGSNWTISPSKIEELLKKKISMDDLTEHYVRITFRQKKRRHAHWSGHCIACVQAPS